MDFSALLAATLASVPPPAAMPMMNPFFMSPQQALLQQQAMFQQPMAASVPAAAPPCTINITTAQWETMTKYANLGVEAEKMKSLEEDASPQFQDNKNIEEIKSDDSSPLESCCSQLQQPSEEDDGGASCEPGSDDDVEIAEHQGSGEAS